jgi:pilus assembly protein FimV
MAFNKIKAQENALKFLNQGKVTQAIAEYQQILRNDPKDQATLMTVGDLFARQGDMGQATEYFERLAQVYLNDGFNSKAIAIYKKIAKLAPNELAPLERLSDLYVQQGVLSEARPLFLQIAEAHLKANRAPKAVEVLHRLLDVEPENLRVQMRLAELYNVMGQKKESALTYLAYAQRLFDRGELDESQKLVERALEVDPANGPALLLKAKALGASDKGEQAIAILASHAEADAGGDMTNLLVDFELRSGHSRQAADRARKQLARGHANFGLLFKVAETLIESGQANEAFPLLQELRAPMVEAGEQEKFLKSLSSTVERLPGQTEPLEMLADFCRHTSDPFRLSDALSRLSDTFASKGNLPRAVELLEEMVDRNKGDERLVDRLNKLRASANGGAVPTVAVEAPTPQVSETTEEGTKLTPAAPPQIVEEVLDEETQKYIAQALTDVDLFSSYGLTQKASHLLENVLQRAPRHTPTLERLLDLYLGAGNERRTAELASQLEQIHHERNDTVNAERFAELRQRFQKAAGLKTEDLPPAPAALPEQQAQASVEAGTVEAPPVEVPVAPIAAAPSAPAESIEFEIPLTESEPEPAQAEAVSVVAPAEAATVEAAPAAPEPQPIVVGEEVDLSDEWEAISQEVAEPAEPAQEQDSVARPAPEPPAPLQEPGPVLAEAEVEATPQSYEITEVHQELEPEPTIEIVEEPAAEVLPAEPVAASSGEFELELTPEPAAVESKAEAATTEDFINELVAEIDDLELAPPPPVAVHKPAPEPVAAPKPSPLEAVFAASPASIESSVAPEPTAESLNQLAEVFQEFRAELGELGEEDEDLETHYNLGIAYREMGLLDEAIGEFQKVAKAVQKGKPFRYAMNCSTLLGVSFMDKGEPKIASLWYQRALEVPGLDQEAILALRYDLGVALDTAGECDAALDSFRQVYAMNIDYRDVADRIATIQKA